MTSRTYRERIRASKARIAAEAIDAARECYSADELIARMRGCCVALDRGFAARLIATFEKEFVR